MHRLLIISCFFLIVSCAKPYQIPITTTSKSALSFYQKGVQLENSQEEELAFKAYQQAIAKDSTFALAHLGLAMVSKDFSKRRVHVGKAMELRSEVSKGEQLWILARNKFYGNGEGKTELAYFQQLVDLYPKDDQANYLFGYINVHHGNKNLPQAIQHLEKAIAINPKILKAYNELIYAYADNRAFEKAETTAAKQIELMPGKVLPLDTYAEVLMRQGKYKASIKAYEKVLKINPLYPWAIMGVAANLNFLNKHTEARQFLNKLAAIEDLSDYEFRHKWKSRVVSHLDEGDYDGAIQVLGQQKAMGIKEVNKHEPFFHAYYSFLRRTRFFFEKGDWKNGLKEYREWQEYVLKTSTNEKTHQRVKMRAAYYQAYAQYLQGNYTDSRKFLENYLVGIGQENDGYRLLLSRILQAEQKFDKALELVKKTDLNNPYNQYHYATILEALGNPEAEKWYKKIQQLNERNEIDLALIRRFAVEKNNSK